MNKTLSIAVWMTFASVVFKLMFYSLGYDLKDSITYVSFFNLLVVSIGTFFGVRQYKISQEKPTYYKEDVKAGLRTAALYALFMGIFVFIYYSYIDLNALEQQIQEKVSFAQAQIQEGEEDKLKDIEATARFIFSPKTHASVTLFAYLLAGVIYSMLIALFMRKFPGFRSR